MVNAPEGLNQFFYRKVIEREKEQERFRKIRKYQNLSATERERESGHISVKFSHLHLNMLVTGLKTRANGKKL